jgi:peptide/nickel transport system substrate-binding protein
VPKGKGTEPPYGEKPVASGPYQVEKYQQGVEVRLVRNPNWYMASDQGRAGLPDQIVLRNEALASLYGMHD